MEMNTCASYKCICLFITIKRENISIIFFWYAVLFSRFLWSFSLKCTALNMKNNRNNLGDICQLCTFIQISGSECTFSSIYLLFLLFFRKMIKHVTCYGRRNSKYICQAKKLNFSSYLLELLCKQRRSRNAIHHW